MKLWLLFSGCAGLLLAFSGAIWYWQKRSSQPITWVEYKQRLKKIL